MKKADLHVHSIYSETPTDFIFKLLNGKECYTKPEEVYSLAKKNGMDYVAITDHNRIEGAMLLKEKFPDEVIVGVEATTYFPEDKCPVHLLIFGLDDVQFQMVEKLRKNIYDLRDFIKSENLPYSLAHANFAEDEKLDIQHIEKLILLFDVFETINGGMNKVNNFGIKSILENLTEAHIDYLYSKHRINPFTDTPWKKGFTGGSDDHAGIFIGTTFTQANVNSIPEFLEAIKNKSTYSYGKNGNYKKFVFSAYKVFYDHWENSKRTFSIKNLIKQKIHGLIFKNENLSTIEKLSLKVVKKLSSNKNIQLIAEHLQKITPHISTDKRLDVIYDIIGNLIDNEIKTIVKSFETTITGGNLLRLVNDTSKILPLTLLTLPFIYSILHINKDNFRIRKLYNNLLNMNYNKGATLWFTDTFNDLNGVSASLNEMLTRLNGRKEIFVVTGESELNQNKIPNLLQLPVIHRISLPYYEKQKISIPSVLKSLKLIEEIGEIKEIIISTPGPIGLFGLLIAKLLNIKSISIYHTDFYAQSFALSENENIATTLENYVKWFYSQTDEILVPTQQYISLLKNRDYPISKLKLFHRGIDKELFAPVYFAKKQFQQEYGIIGRNLLYVGRISKDKGIDFLIECFEEVKKSIDNLNLILVGDGPYKSELENKIMNRRIFLLGKVSREKLPLIYSASDLFLFPSITDTFGLAVLEAQMCELPAIVSDIGGPQEIVINRDTGLIIEAWNKNAWVEGIKAILYMIDKDLDAYINLKINSRKFAMERYDFDRMISYLFDDVDNKELITQL